MGTAKQQKSPNSALPSVGCPLLSKQRKLTSLPDICVTSTLPCPAHHPSPPFPQDLNRAAITALLDSCLLSDKEIAAGRSTEEWLKEDPLFGLDD